jgi:hypothetical protein
MVFPSKSTPNSKTAAPPKPFKGFASGLLPTLLGVEERLAHDPTYFYWEGAQVAFRRSDELDSLDARSYRRLPSYGETTIELAWFLCKRSGAVQAGIFPNQLAGFNRDSGARLLAAFCGFAGEPEIAGVRIDDEASWREIRR